MAQERQWQLREAQLRGASASVIGAPAAPTLSLHEEAARLQELDALLAAMRRSNADQAQQGPPKPSDGGAQRAPSVSGAGAPAGQHGVGAAAGAEDEARGGDARTGGDQPPGQLQQLQPQPTSGPPSPVQRDGDEDGASSTTEEPLFDGDQAAAAAEPTVSPEVVPLPPAKVRGGAGQGGGFVVSYEAGESLNSPSGAACRAARAPSHRCSHAHPCSATLAVDRPRDVARVRTRAPPAVAGAEGRRAACCGAWGPAS